MSPDCGDAAAQCVWDGRERGPRTGTLGRLGQVRAGTAGLGLGPARGWDGVRIGRGGRVGSHGCGVPETGPATPDNRVDCWLRVLGCSAWGRTEGRRGGRGGRGERRRAAANGGNLQNSWQEQK